MSARRTSSLLVSLLLAVALVPLAAGTASAAPAPAAGITNIDYIISAHPDDEYQAYSKFDGLTSGYRVYVYMTRGEQTSQCRSRTDPALKDMYAPDQPGLGPWGYQGPNPAIDGQPNRGEIDPRYNGLPPWDGQWRAGCVNARIKGTLAFLDALGANDGGQPRGFTTSKTFFNLGYSAGVDPRRYDDHDNSRTPTPINDYATVYWASNGRGAAVFFDLGDGDLTDAEAKWAIQKLLSRASAPAPDGFGFPNVTIDDMIGNFYNRYYGLGPLDNPPCRRFWDQPGAPDHGAVHRVLFANAFAGVADRYGRSCIQDPDATSSAIVSSTRHDGAWKMSGSTRVGTFERTYGWLASDFWPVPPPSNDTFSASQRFWRR